MGCIPSKDNELESYSNILASYESEIRNDPSLQSFDKELRDSTTLAIKSVVNSPSLDSLLPVTKSLADINEQVVLYIQSKEDIWRNPDLRDLVEEYFNSSTQLLGFYFALENYMMKIKNNHIFIKLAITRFEEEKTKPGSEFSKTLQELENFKSAADPFTNDFILTLLSSVSKRQDLMLSKLRDKREKLDRKLKGLTSYRKVSDVLFAAASAAVVICSVVAAVIASPPAVAALLQASSAPLEAAKNWMSSLWKEYEDKVKKEQNLVREMDIHTLAAGAELQNIRTLVDDLKEKIEALFNAGVAVEPDNEAVVSLVINNIKENLEVFTKAADFLGEQSYKYRSNIWTGREVILQKIRDY